AWLTTNRGGTKDFAIVSKEAAVSGLAQPHCFFEHRVEHRREIAGRGIDDPQDLGGRGLCFKASRVSVISRAFSIAITACAAKFSSSAICLSENGNTSRRVAAI